MDSPSQAFHVVLALAPLPAYRTSLQVMPAFLPPSKVRRWRPYLAGTPTETFTLWEAPWRVLGVKTDERSARALLREEERRLRDKGRLLPERSWLVFARPGVDGERPRWLLLHVGSTGIASAIERREAAGWVAVAVAGDEVGGRRALHQLREGRRESGNDLGGWLTVQRQKLMADE